MITNTCWALTTARAAMIFSVVAQPLRSEGAGDLADIGVVESGGEKTMILDGTQSDDKAYAIGWTLRAKRKSSPPVNWALWNPAEPRALLDEYHWDEDDAPYEIANHVIDLQRKKLAPLRSSSPYWPTKNRGDLAAMWAPKSGPRRYGLIENDTRFETLDLWLVSGEASGALHVTDLSARLLKEVRKLLREKRPWIHNEYCVFFPVANQGDDQPGSVFDAQTVKIPFVAEIPKRSDGSPAPRGTITVRLADGAVLKVLCETRRDDPFTDDPSLVAADARLNKTYAAAMKKLQGKARESLRAEQREWIHTRDNSALDAIAGSNEGAEGSARNRALQEATEARITELKAER